MDNIQKLYNEWIQANINTEEYYKEWEEWIDGNYKIIIYFNTQTNQLTEWDSFDVIRKFNTLSKIEHEFWYELVEKLGDNIYKLDNGQYLVVIDDEDGSRRLEERNCLN